MNDTADQKEAVVVQRQQKRYLRVIVATVRLREQDSYGAGGPFCCRDRCHGSTRATVIFSPLDGRMVVYGMIYVQPLILLSSLTLFHAGTLLLYMYLSFTYVFVPDTSIACTVVMLSQGCRLLQMPAFGMAAFLRRSGLRGSGEIVKCRAGRPRV